MVVTNSRKEISGFPESQTLNGYEPSSLLWTGQLKSKESDPLEILLLVLPTKVKTSLLAIIKVEVSMDCHLLICII